MWFNGGMAENTLPQSVGYKVLASGRVAVVEPDGRVSEIVEQDDYFYEPEQCECELDWNCGLHSDRIYTGIELLTDARTAYDDPRGF